MKFSSCSSSALFLGYSRKVFTDDQGKSSPYLMLDFYDSGRVFSLSSVPFTDKQLDDLRFCNVVITCEFSRRFRNGGYVWIPRVVGMVAE